MRSSDEVLPPHNNFLGIRGRLYVGFGAIILLMLISIIMVFIEITMIEEIANSIITVDIPLQKEVSDLESKITDFERSLLYYTVSHDAKLKPNVTNFWQDISVLQNNIDEYATHDANQSINEKKYFKDWQQMKSLIQQLKEKSTPITKTVDFNQVASLITTQLYPVFNQIDNLVHGSFHHTIDNKASHPNGMLDRVLLEINDDNNSVIHIVETIRIMQYTLFAIVVIISLLIIYFTKRGIINYVNIFRQQSNRIAGGDLTQRILLVTKDEMGQLGKDLNVMTDSLSRITKQITSDCHNMIISLEEVKQAANVQSTGATEQASSINEITSSLEQIEKSSNQTMEKAKALGATADRTREKSQLGLEAVEQSILGMKTAREKVQTIAQTILELSSQTQQISEISAVVNALAQQLKMLALNASIEAAKAGDAGKGFAVVAEEVKNLAEQSEQSIVQVQNILEDIRHASEKAVMATEEGTKGVDHGTGLVEQTGEIVRGLNAIINETSIASQQIEVAVRQESVGIEQITIGMNEINQVTSTFVVNVKQTLEAINNLTMIAKSLREYVDLYKT